MWKKNNRGFNLLNVMIGFAILGIILVVYNALMGQFNQVQSDQSKQGNLEDLRNFVRLSLDCTATAASAPVGCTGNQKMVIKNKAETVVIGKNPPFRTIGTVTIRAICLQKLSGKVLFNVEYKKATESWPQPPQWLMEIPIVC